MPTPATPRRSRRHGEGGLDLPSVAACRLRPSDGAVAPSSRDPSGDRPPHPRSRPGRDPGRQRRAAPRGRAPRRPASSRTRSSSAATGRIEAVGRDARPARRRWATTEEIDGRGLVRDPRARRLPHPRVLRRRPGQRVLAPRGRRLVRGAPRGGRRHPLDGAGDPRGGRGRARRASRCGTAAGCGRTGRRRSRASRATASTTTPSSRSCARSAPRAASRPGSAPTRSRPSSPTPTPTSTSCSPRCCPRRRRSPRPPTSSSSAARSTPRRRGATSEACRDAGLALRLHGDQFTESGAIGLAIELGARSVDHLEATGPAGVAQLAASDVTGVLLPASALFLGRPMPPARALADAGALDRARHRLQPGQRVLRQPAARPLARLHPAEARARGGARRGDRERRPRARPRRPDRAPRSPGFAADVVLLDASDWRHVAYHLAGDIVHTVVEGGAVAFRRTA